MSASPTRQEAIDAAAAIYLEEKIRIETERIIAEAAERAEREVAA
ncbi:hypothetical protein [Microbacterium sp. NPDC080220]